MRLKRSLVLAAVATVLAAGTAWIILPASADETAATLPLAVTNDTGRTEPVFRYVLGTNLTTGKLGYADAAGAFTSWTGGAPVPCPPPTSPSPGRRTVRAPPSGCRTTCPGGSTCRSARSWISG